MHSTTALDNAYLVSISSNIETVKMKTFSIIIPAYNPGNELIELVEKILQTDIANIIIVNDGSKDDSNQIFNAIKNLNEKITVLKHAINLGKGAALKTGLHYAYTHFNNTEGVVTADADGQHLIKDILRVGQALIENPKKLVIGVRQFSASGGNAVPMRSKIGNLLTIKLFKLIVGQRVSDTQSGLRGIPLDFIPSLLKINNNGYEFELNMLIACKYNQRQIQEIPITTVYIDNNKSSHFNPIFDSLKIYFVLFRFAILSLLTFVLDLTVFAFLSYHGYNILTGQIFGRVAGILFNYPIAKKMVFHCSENARFPFLKYLTLVAANGAISFTLIDYIVAKYSFSPVLIKVLVESLLFLANFAIARDFIFTRKAAYEN